MNSPKLTNALLIALIAINSLMLVGWITSSAQHRHGDRFAMQNQFRGRHHDSFTFHRCFGACRSNHGGYYGGFRNRGDFRRNQYRNNYE